MPVESSNKTKRMTTTMCCTISVKQYSNTVSPHNAVSQTQFSSVPTNVETEAGGYSDQSNEHKMGK